MKMNRVDELKWWASIASEVKYKYVDHNESILIELLSYLNTRIEQEENTVIARFKSNNEC